jgi:hypothetical protein
MRPALCQGSLGEGGRMIKDNAFRTRHQRLCRRAARHVCMYVCMYVYMFTVVM